MRTGASLLAALLIVILGFGSALADRRVALVIGNSGYQHTQTLPNPRNDAQDMSETLTKLGFTVISGVDIDKASMDGLLARFARAASGADAALIFYAGHGLQYRGQSYLMPVDAKLEDEVSVTFEMTRVDDLRSALERATGVKMLILDACRNNPLAEQLLARGSSRAVEVSRGLSRIENSQGMLVAYSTQPNQVAADGGGRNSPFTAALLKEMPTPNVEVGALFRRVAAAVNTDTQGKQLPELSISILGEFFFAKSETDSDVWRLIGNSVKRADFDDFVQRFPTSPFVELARSRIALIDRFANEKQAEIERQERAREEEKRKAELKAAEEKAEQERIAKEEAAKKEAAERERLRLAAEARDKRLKELALEAEKLRQEQLALLAQIQPAVPEVAPPVAPIVVAPSAVPIVATPPAVPIAVAPPSAPIVIKPAAPIVVAALPPVANPPTPNPAVANVLDRPRTILAVKRELTRLGCYAGPVDGRWPTTPVSQALKAFALEKKIAQVPSEPTADLLANLVNAPANFCDVACDGRPLKADGSCSAPLPVAVKPKSKPEPAKTVAKRRPVREHRVVEEVRPRPEPATTRRPTRPVAAPASHPSGCFNYNGQSFC